MIAGDPGPDLPHLLLRQDGLRAGQAGDSGRGDLLLLGSDSGDRGGVAPGGTPKNIISHCNDGSKLFISTLATSYMIRLHYV